METADFSQPQAPLSPFQLEAGRGVRARLPFRPRKAGGSQTDFAARIHLPKAARGATDLTERGDRNPAGLPLPPVAPCRGGGDGRAGVFVTHGLWNSLVSVPQPLLGTMPEPFLKSCVTYQLLRAKQQGIHHPERRQDQRGCCRTNSQPLHKTHSSTLGGSRFGSPALPVTPAGHLVPS